MIQTRLIGILFIGGCSISPAIFAQMPGGGGGDAPVFEERRFSDRVWESGGPRVNQKHNGKLVLGIQIEGNETISQHNVLSHMQTRQDRVFNEKQLQLDIHELYRTELFQHIRSEIIEEPGGVVVRLKLQEQPMVSEVIFLGNTRLNDSDLKKHCGIDVGDPANPFSVEMAQQRLLDLYREKGMNQASVEVLEGNRAGQRRVIFAVDEGPVERIWAIRFIGNRLFRSDVLKTKVESKDSWLGLKPFGNLANRIKIEDDAQALIELYRSLGYFQARVDYQLDYHSDGSWLDLTFVIDEGPQFRIRNISVVGNEYPPFTSEFLLASMDLKPGDAFNHPKMSNDQRRMRNEFYGRDGFIYVDIVPQAVFLDEPGWLDLVYKITEGDQYVAGDIHIHMVGDSNHTKRSVPLNLISVIPGQLIDLRELEGSERRLKLSQIFEVNPTLGEPPRIQVRRGDVPLDF
jgi:outer membrane protein insertion porin family